MSARPEWRCYFCDEVFKTPGEAGDHFGASLTDKPGCLIDYRVQVEAGTTTRRGRGLLMALRKAEAELMRYGSEDTDLHRYMHRLQSDHQQALLREEEKGYARGLRDARSAFDAVLDQEKDITVRETLIEDYERALYEGATDGVTEARK